MSGKIVWDETGKRFYETGVSKGVLFPMSNGVYGKGVPWNGLVSVTESPTGAEVSALYADNIKYLNLMSAEEFEASIEAYTYPDEFAVCDGSAVAALGMLVNQQSRSQFALCYQTKLGNDANPELGFKLHIIYGALAAPTERAYESVNDSPEAMTFSWEITTTPVAVTGFKPTAHIVIDSTKANSAKLTQLLDILYGKDAVVEPAAPAVDPALILPDAIIAILGQPA